jgi:hypothetical protein
LSSPGKTGKTRRVTPEQVQSIFGEKTMKFGTFFAGAALLAFAVIPSSANAQRHRDRDRGDQWEQLGCAQVGRRADFDEIKVGRHEGRYTAIRLEAKGNDISIIDLKVIYANGDPDSLQVGSDIREGEQTRSLDLRGRDRAIDSVQIISKKDFKGRGHGRAEVCVSGLKVSDLGNQAGGGGGGQRGDWQELGCQTVGFFSDRDVVKVGRSEGRFKAIKLRVTGNSVFIKDLKVVYANGDPDNIPVSFEVRENSETRPLDLKGFNRAIDRVEMVYRAKPNFRGKAKVCVSGLQ